MITKNVLLGTLDELSNKVYNHNYAQLTIDIIDELIPEYITGSLNRWEETVGALSYKLMTLLEVMDKSTDDYELIFNLYKIINE